MKMTQPNLTDKAKDARNISFTADHHPYWRTFFEGLGPWVQDMSNLTHSKEAFDRTMGAGTEDMIPIFDARYLGTLKTVQRLISELSIEQVVCYGAGMEEMRIAIVSGNPRVKYLETDISPAFKSKPRLADILFTKHRLPNRRNLLFQYADIRNPDEIQAAFEHAGFSIDKPVLGVTQGVIDYYKKIEIESILAVQTEIMTRFGNGKSKFATPDFTFDDESIPIFFRHSKKAAEIMAKMKAATGRDYDKGLGNREATERFVGEQGFKFEKLGRDELGYPLGSLDKVGLDSETKRQLEEDLRKYMKTWVLSLK